MRKILSIFLLSILVWWSAAVDGSVEVKYTKGENDQPSEMNSKSIVSHPFSRVWQAIADINNWNQVMDTPFSVANRWFLLCYIHDETQANQGRYSQCWKMIDANVDYVDGCFKVQPTSEQKNTRLHFHERVDLGGHVPEWVVKIGIRHATPKVFKNLSEYLETKASDPRL
jgi:hypothetical protein